MNRRLLSLCVLSGAILRPQTPTPTSAARYVSETEGLDATALVRQALTGNKDLQAAREQLRQAEGRLLQEGLRPNPTLDAAYTTDRLSPNSKGSGGYSVSYTQPFEPGGKRAKRVRVAEVAVEIARAQIADAERLAAAQVRTLYGEALAAAARLDLLDQTVDLSGQMLKVMLVRRKAGDASRLDETLLRASSNQIEAQRIQAEAQVADLVLQITNLIGQPAGASVPLRNSTAPAPQLTEEEALALALQDRPDLQAARLRERLAEAGIDLAKSQIVPPISGFARFAQDKLVLEDLPRPGAAYIENDHTVSFGVSIPLPLFNRQQGAIAEAVSQKAQARAQRESTELTVRREVATAYANYGAAKKTLEALRAGVVGQDRESFQIVRLAYQLGELRLLDVLNQQRILIDAQTAYAAAERDYYVAVADLDRAVGKR